MRRVGRNRCIFKSVQRPTGSFLFCRVYGILMGDNGPANGDSNPSAALAPASCPIGISSTSRSMKAQQAWPPQALWEKKGQCLMAAST